MGFRHDVMDGEVTTDVRKRLVAEGADAIRQRLGVPAAQWGGRTMHRESMRQRSGGVRALKTATCVAWLLTGGCAPMIAHGPRVHPGWTSGIGAAIGGGPTYENGDSPGPVVAGAFQVNAAYGWVPERESRPAARVGVQGPSGDAAAVDAFVQLPRAWLGPVAAGAGWMLLVPEGRSMPYVQLGAFDARGRGAHLFVTAYDDREETFAFLNRQQGSLSWLSVQLPVWPMATLHVQGGFVHGRFRQRFRNTGALRTDENRHGFLAALTAEFHQPRR